MLKDFLQISDISFFSCDSYFFMSFCAYHHFLFDLYFALSSFICFLFKQNFGNFKEMSSMWVAIHKPSHSLWSSRALCRMLLFKYKLHSLEICIAACDRHEIRWPVRSADCRGRNIWHWLNVYLKRWHCMHVFMHLERYIPSLNNFWETPLVEQ